MASGRPSDRERRPRRGESSATRRWKRVRPSTVGRGSGGRPGGGKGAARPRPRSSTSTGGAFKLSSTRHAAVLAILVCAMALSVSVPLRNYLSQRAELAALEQHKTELVNQVEQLKDRRAELSDPVHVETEARARLGLVRPGETPYIVQVPPSAIRPEPPPRQKQPKQDDRPWYEQWWASLTGAGS